MLSGVWASKSESGHPWQMEDQGGHGGQTVLGDHLHLESPVIL